jgi:hypothetical protein
MKFCSIAAVVGAVTVMGHPERQVITDPTSVLEALSSDGVLPTNTDPSDWWSAFNSLKSEGKIPTAVTVSPAHPTGYGPGQGPITAHRSGEPSSHGPPGRGQWGGPDGCGPWGSGSWGPFSHWATDSSWRSNGPWTNWWGGSACPGSDWPGWTAGPWSTDAPWTTWSGCTASTTATSVVSKSVSGSKVVSTAYGVRVAQASAVTGSPTRVGASGAAVPAQTAAPVLALGAAVMGLAAAL